MTVMDGGAISYQYDLDIPEIAELWRRGSVIASWLRCAAAHRRARVQLLRQATVS